jgi:hypothetical protein
MRHLLKYTLTLESKNCNFYEISTFHTLCLRIPLIAHPIS